MQFFLSKPDKSLDMDPQHGRQQCSMLVKA